MQKNTASPIDWKVESRRFDGVAEIYDAYRPSYPPELVETIINVSDIRSDQSVLEIGSGTGIATRLFAEQGLSILALEPGDNLIKLARENLRSYPQVSFANARFEDWKAAGARFDLIFSAQAFHWVPEEVRLVKTAALLKDQGYLAIFWNKYPGIEGEIGSELDQVYREEVPEMGPLNIPTEETIKRRAKSLSDSGLYEDVIWRTFPWIIRYNTQAYIGLLNSYSDHLRLSDQKRKSLFTVVAGVIERHGGTIDRPYMAVLYMARKKTML